MFGFCGCGKKYNVDYEGQKSFYKGARDSYREGERVRMYYFMIATDTDYSFFLDGERLNPAYDERKGYIIEFTMPAHDVKLICESKNSMLVLEAEPVLLVDYYDAVTGTDGYDSSRELTLSELSDGTYQVDVYRTGRDEDSHESFTVPEEAKTRCYELIDKYNMRHWDRYPDDPLDGGMTAVKFRDTDGSYIRVSTDQMPDGGTGMMSDIASVMREYIG